MLEKQRGNKARRERGNREGQGEGDWELGRWTDEREGGKWAGSEAWADIARETEGGQEQKRRKRGGSRGRLEVRKWTNNGEKETLERDRERRD